MPIATWEDVAVALGRPLTDFTETQQQQYEYWLRGVELRIVGRLGPVDDLDEDVVRYVEAEAVAEKARRLADGGATSVTVSVDDGTLTRRFEGVKASDITDELWSYFGSVYTGSAYSVQTYSPLDAP